MAGGREQGRPQNHVAVCSIEPLAILEGEGGRAFTGRPAGGGGGAESAYRACGPSPPQPMPGGRLPPAHTLGQEHTRGNAEGETRGEERVSRKREEQLAPTVGGVAPVEVGQEEEEVNPKSSRPHGDTKRVPHSVTRRMHVLGMDLALTPLGIAPPPKTNSPMPPPPPPPSLSNNTAAAPVQPRRPTTCSSP